MDFVDVTCHNAVADQYGVGSVTLVTDPDRPGKVALFDGRAHLEVGRNETCIHQVMSLMA